VIRGTRDVLEGALARALSSIDLRARVRDATKSGMPDGPARILAIGKASGAMVHGALDALDGRLTKALVILPQDAPHPPEDARLDVRHGSHPLPDERSVAAGRAALSFVHDGGSEPWLALVSGGASALAFVPVHAGELADAVAAMRALLVSGATVREVNVVRRHGSRAHGGALAAPGMLTLLASDVIGGRPFDIGSGPTVVDPSSCDDARAILRRFAPQHAGLSLVETAKSRGGDARFAREPLVVVAPGDLAEALARELVSIGFVSQVASPTTADLARVAAETIDLARALGPGEAVVRSAEPSITADPRRAGAGGRCTHLAALVARDLPCGVTFLAAASDGVDGPSGTAGAIVSRESFADAAAVEAALAAFDTGALHRAAGTALPRHPTALNLTDLHALVRSRR
jgi:hydroxypyruvate reductase